jgi:proteasome activator subunit 4
MRMIRRPSSDGKAALKYKDRLISLLQLLRQKTFSKRGFTWTGRLLSSVLLTLTHTYPTENKFVNPDEWASKGEFGHLRLH